MTEAEPGGSGRLINQINLSHYQLFIQRKQIDVGLMMCCGVKNPAAVRRDSSGRDEDWRHRDDHLRFFCSTVRQPHPAVLVVAAINEEEMAAIVEPFRTGP